MAEELARQIFGGCALGHRRVASGAATHLVAALRRPDRLVAPQPLPVERVGEADAPATTLTSFRIPPGVAVDIAVVHVFGRIGERRLKLLCGIAGVGERRTEDMDGMRRWIVAVLRAKGLHAAGHLNRHGGTPRMVPLVGRLDRLDYANGAFVEGTGIGDALIDGIGHDQQEVDPNLRQIGKPALGLGIRDIARIVPDMANAELEHPRPHNGLVGGVVDRAQIVDVGVDARRIGRKIGHQRRRPIADSAG